MAIERSSHAALALVILLCIGGCESVDAPHGATRARVDPQWVTGSAAAALDSATGLIRLEIPDGNFISRLAAESIAVGAMHFYLSPDQFIDLPAALEHDRGGPID